MPKQNNQKLERLFSKLSDCGYSEKAATAIWLWYNPSKKVEAVSNSKNITKE